MGELPQSISLKAMQPIVREYRHALAAQSVNGKLPKKPLKPCDVDCSVGDQYELPCHHTIFRHLEEGKPLGIQTVHPHWRFSGRLDESDPWLRIQNPKTVVPRGRPRNSGNLTMPQGATLPKDGETVRKRTANKNIMGKRAPAKNKKSGKKSEKPGPPKGNSARLAPSIRRRRSEWELIDDDVSLIETQDSEEEQAQEEEAIEEVVEVAPEPDVEPRSSSGSNLASSRAC
ncbi:hypothetical protein QBC43DRAFT_293828 [Cladorrhinum sp. PSN259]|nr:hypothetical protein QBC43DRAFT_293828 [Cladorrhinum sp. PSN259]